MTNPFENTPVIYSYTLDDALRDGVLVKLLPHRWGELTGGKPLVCTIAVHNAISLAGIMEIWNQYVNWRTNVMDTLPEEEQMFTTKMNGRTCWVMEDSAAFTIMFDSDH